MAEVGISADSSRDSSWGIVTCYSPFFNKFLRGTKYPPTSKKSLRTQNRASFFRRFYEKSSIFSLKGAIMKRFKKPKENKEKPVKVSTSFIMKVIMPCVMLACKDVFKIKDQSKLDILGQRIQHYIDLIADKKVSESQLAELMEIREATEATNYLESVTRDME